MLSQTYSCQGKGLNTVLIGRYIYLNIFGLAEVEYFMSTEKKKKNLDKMLYLWLTLIVKESHFKTNTV